MDLLNVINKEINQLNLSDKLSIARYIYIKTGLVFEYDPFYAISNSEEKEVIKNIKIDYRNVKSFYLVCFAWANLYVDLLQSFNIPSKVVDKGDHAYAIYFLNGKTFLADLTNANEDIMRVKFHLPTCFNRQIAPVAPRNDDSFADIDKKFYNFSNTEAMIRTVQSHLESKKTSLNDVQYMHYVFELIQKIMLFFDSNNAGMVTGTKFIDYLLEKFIDSNTQISCFRCFDTKNRNCFQTYVSKDYNSTFYYTYKQEANGRFYFREKTEREVLILENSSDLVLKLTNVRSNKHYSI